MTAPTRTELTWAARQHLMAYQPFLDLIGTDVGSDVTHGAAYPDQNFEDGWVFIGVNQDGRPVRDPTGTGTSAVTMDMYGAPWGTPNQHNSAEFPSLRVIVWSDPTRADPSAGGNLIAMRDAEDRCMKVRQVIKDLFHDPLNDTHAWNGVKFGTCLLGSELPLRDVLPYDGLVAGELRFNVEAA